MKVFTMILQLYANLIATGPEYADKVMRETSLLNLFFVIIDNPNLILSDQVTDAVARMV